MRCSVCSPPCFLHFDHPLRQRARRLNPLHIVHGHQRLQRRVRSLPPRANHIAHRRVERIHIRLHRHALPIGVHAAPVKRVAVVLLIHQRVAAADTDCSHTFAG